MPGAGAPTATAADADATAAATDATAAAAAIATINLFFGFFLPYPGLFPQFRCICRIRSSALKMGSFFHIITKNGIAASQCCFEPTDPPDNGP